MLPDKKALVIALNCPNCPESRNTLVDSINQGIINEQLEVLASTSSCDPRKCNSFSSNSYTSGHLMLSDIGWVSLLNDWASNTLTHKTILGVVFKGNVSEGKQKHIPNVNCQSSFKQLFLSILSKKYYIECDRNTCGHVKQIWKHKCWEIIFRSRMICCAQVFLLLFAFLPLAIPSYAGIQDKKGREDSPVIPLGDIWRWFRLVTNIFIKNVSNPCTLIIYMDQHT